MKKIYYEQNTVGNYARLDAIKQGLLETGRFTLISEDDDSVSNSTTETSKKVVLKYQGLSENIVLTETSPVYHYLKFQGGQEFVRSDYASGKTYCHVILFDDGFVLSYGTEGNFFGAFEKEGKKMIFWIGLTGGMSTNNGLIKGIQLLRVGTYLHSVEGKAGYIPVLYWSDDGRERVMQKDPFPHLYQGLGIPSVDPVSVVTFESGKRFFALNVSSVIGLLISLEGELE